MGKERIRRKRWLYLVRKAAEEQFLSPAPNLRKECFEYRSYQRWAVNEIIKAVKESDQHPRRTIEDFMERMDDYSCRNLNTSLMFSIAKDVAQDIYFSLH